MSNKAEEIAYEIYPAHSSTAVLSSAQVDLLRTGFIKGYEQAEKDTIERAARWIMKSENQVKVRFRITDDEFIELFRKEMEEE